MPKTRVIILGTLPERPDDFEASKYKTLSAFVQHVLQRNEPEDIVGWLDDLQVLHTIDPHDGAPRCTDDNPELLAVLQDSRRALCGYASTEGDPEEWQANSFFAESDDTAAEGEWAVWVDDCSTIVHGQTRSFCEYLVAHSPAKMQQMQDGVVALLAEVAQLRARAERADTLAKAPPSTWCHCGRAHRPKSCCPAPVFETLLTGSPRAPEDK